jgi:hypothetical protein
MSFNFAYLSEGLLHLKFGQAKIQTVKSEFGEAARDRIWQMQRRNSWKQNNVIPNLIPSGLVGDRGSQESGILPVAVTGVCQTNSDRLLYTLEAGEVGGIFALDCQQSNEKRLFHSADFKVQDLDFHPEHQLIACAVMRKDGSANIATMPSQGVRLAEVTEGDSIDLAPKWVAGNRRTIVFQSAGISRDASGHPIECGHTTIEQLDLDRQEVITLASDPKYDFLTPQLTADGTLYYIRRPYRSQRRRVGIWTTVKDLLLMPIRLLNAIFAWLNFFTRRYTGKSLLPVNPTPARAVQQMLFLGQLVDVAAEIDRNRRCGDADTPALVPRSWQLIRQRLHQPPESSGHGVLAFDLGADGTVIYSNGSAIYGIRPGGVAERLIVDRPIEQVILLGSENFNLN